MSVIEEREIPLVPATDHAPALFALDPAAFPVPTGREEEWRFTPLSRLSGLHTDARPEGATWIVSCDNAQAAQFDATAAKSGDRVGFTDRVAAAAWSAADSVAVLTVPDNAVVADHIDLAYAGSGVSYGQLDVVVGRQASATVILRHTGSGVLDANVDLRVGDGSSLTFVSVQDWQPGSVHTTHHRITLGRDASIKHVIVTLGGDVVRILPSVSYTAPGGQAELLGLYFAGAGEHAEQRLFVDHNVDHCRSNVVYKGALNGEKARTVWVGDVLIRANAVGTDTYEINRNLVLGGGGRADSVPNLEIETGEIVGAGHASTTGRFDDEQLFYLMSRGISAEEARRLVLRGFFDDLLNQIAVPSIEERVRERIDERLVGA